VGNRDGGLSGRWPIGTWLISTWSIATWSIATWSIGTVVNINVAKWDAPLNGIMFRHIASPDCASRGISEEFSAHPLWWSGPAWLKGPPDFRPNRNQNWDELPDEFASSAKSEMRPYYYSSKIGSCDSRYTRRFLLVGKNAPRHWSIIPFLENNSR